MDEAPVIHIIGDAGIAGLSNRDEGVIEKAFGLTLMLKPDVDQLEVKSFVGWMKLQSFILLAMPVLLVYRIVMKV